MSASLKSLLFALGLCVVCSLLLTAASSGLRPWQERNALVDRHRNILAAAGVIQEDPDPAKSASGLPIYLTVEGADIRGYIVPIESRGVWGPIHGYLALDRDGKTVEGFAVYRHSETPGLGGEIEKKWFRENWVGKKIATREGKFVSVGIAKGRAEGALPEERRPHYVDGISGATLTGKYLSAGIRDTLSRYEPVSIKFRKNQLTALGLPSPAASP
jgi:Na+-transporting NADH:ubiquinone oxidoreductase subunit C